MCDRKRGGMNDAGSEEVRVGCKDECLSGQPWHCGQTWDQQLPSTEYGERASAFGRWPVVHASDPKWPKGPERVEILVFGRLFWGKQ